MAEFDYAALLERARSGMSRDELAPVVPSLLDVSEDFENPTKLRLLGNAIANNGPNAAALQRCPEAIDRLLEIEPLGLQILYNGCVGNKEFAQTLINTPCFADRLQPSPVSKNLVGAIFESLGDDKAPQDFVAELALNGFVELILDDPELEQHPKILQNFERIYQHCQEITTEAFEDGEAAEELTSLGFRVVGNISSRPEFGFEEVERISKQPFTWDTVALLVNLTAQKINLDRALKQWPNMVSETIRLLQLEDPSDVPLQNSKDAGQESDSEGGGETIENEDEDDDEDRSGDEVFNAQDQAEQGEDIEDDAESDEQKRNEEPPFDLSLWGPLFRNIARHPPAAGQIAQHEPAKLVSRLLEEPRLHDVAWDFASTFATNQYSHNLTSLVTQPPYSSGSVLAASAIVERVVGAQQLPQSEIDWAVPRLLKAIIDGLPKTEQVPAWVKGTRALALIKVAFSIEIDSDALNSAAPKNEAVHRNLQALNETATPSN